MKNLIALLSRNLATLLPLYLATLLPCNLAAQTWSTPVNVSTMGGYNEHPDIIAGPNGTLHCTWSHKVTHNPRFYKIYYSKSNDNGTTWSEPMDVVQNDSLWLTKPHLVFDKNNKLMLFYDYDVMKDKLIMYKVFDGTQWGDSVIVTNDFYGSFYNLVYNDYNGRVYVFWIRGEIFYYKYYENNVWSEVFRIFNNANFYGLAEAVIDNNNNIHCIGAFHDSTQSHYNNVPIYFKYNYANNQWSDITILSELHNWSGYGISLDKAQNPHVVWREVVDTGYYDYDDNTHYSFFNGTNWSVPDTLKAKSPSYQQIQVDNNDTVHIVVCENLNVIERLLYYKKNNNVWEKYIIDSTEICVAQSNLIDVNNYLAVIYVNIPFTEGGCLITYSKIELPVSIKHEKEFFDSDNSLVQNYPNPFTKTTTISYTGIKELLNAKAEIYNINGQFIEALTFESNKLEWNSGKNKPGIYLYQIKSDNYISKTQIMIKQ